MDRQVDDLRSAFAGLLAGIELPRFADVRQVFPQEHLPDPAAHLLQELDQPWLRDRIRPGGQIAITASSRGIRHQKELLRAIVSFVREQGAQPIIIPAMGSHGGATAQGQVQILAEYGITEAFCGCPIHSDMTTSQSGVTPQGQAVYTDAFARGCDGILVFGRIKPHSAFKATYESGLVKMLAIGLGKQKGADSLHDAGFGTFATRLPAYAKVVLANNPVLAGIGVIENAMDETCRVEVIRSEEILDREPGLLEFAKAQMPRICLDETDILIVREIGKNFSGSGMDPNITGTWSTPYGSGGIHKQRVVVLDVTEESQGNIIGLGKADVTTQRAVAKMDPLSTYANVLTSTVIEPAKIPMWMVNDELAIKAAIKTLTGVSKQACRIVMIRNTLDLDRIWVSEALLPQLAGTPQVEILSGLQPLRFDDSGNLLK